MSQIRSQALTPMMMRSICSAIIQSFIQIYTINQLMGSGICNCKSKTEQIQLVIGAYSYRGTIHVCRLLCQYMKVPYSNQFYDPYTWQLYKNTHTDNWLFSQLPYLKDGEFIVTDTHAIAQYLIKRQGKLELLGKNIYDQAEVDHFLFGKSLLQGVLSIVVEYKDKMEQLYPDSNQIWTLRVEPILVNYENKALENSFYLGYLSLIDFFLYEIMDLIFRMFPDKMHKFPKLVTIRKAVQEIPEIKEYETSNRTIKNSCPLEFWAKWKQTCKYKK